MLLLPGGVLDTTRLTPHERDQLLLTGLDPRQREALGFEEDDRRVHHKLRQRTRRSPDGLLPLSEVVLTDNRPWHIPEGSGTSPAAMIDTLRRQRQLHINYASANSQEASWRTVDPYGLLAKASTWYLVADHHGEPHLYRLDRLTRWKTSRRQRRLRPNADLDSTAADLIDQWNRGHDVSVDATMDSAQIARARRILGHRLTIETPVAPSAQHVPVTLKLRDLEELRTLLPFGSSINVTGPPEARQRLRELAEELASHYC